MNMQLSIETLFEWKTNKVPHQLIDIREPYEVEVCNIEGMAIPMQEILERTAEIDTTIPVVIHCNSGKRSDAVCYALRQALHRKDIFSLTGGIQAFTTAYLPEQSCAQ